MQQRQPNYSTSAVVDNNRGVGWGRNRQTADPTPCDHTTAGQKDDPAPVCGRHTKPYRRTGDGSTPGSCAPRERPRNISRRRASATSMRAMAIDSTSAIAAATAAAAASTVMMAAEQDRCR